MKNMIPVLLLLLLQGCMNEKKDNNAGDTKRSGLTDDELYARQVNRGLLSDTVKKSVQRFTTAMFNGNEISIDYFSPGVKDRIIWGGLVPYGQVWVTGAHSATKISFTKDIRIHNTKLTSGSYAIFTIPGKENWVFILNKNFRQHLTDEYDQKQDVLRINLIPVQNNNDVKRLTYDITPTGEGSGHIIFSWEKIQLDLPFKTEEGATATQPTDVPDRSILKNISLALKTDPVCLMPVTAGLADTCLYRNKIYGFCSSGCKQQFRKDPASYLTDEKK
jgi:YHS domain-containing protein